MTAGRGAVVLEGCPRCRGAIAEGTCLTCGWDGPTIPDPFPDDGLGRPREMGSRRREAGHNHIGRGRKRAVVAAEQQPPRIDGRGISRQQWRVELDCGHVVMRVTVGEFAICPACIGD